MYPINTKNDWTTAQKNKRFAELYVMECGYNASAAYRKLWQEIHPDGNPDDLKDVRRVAYTYRHRPAVQKHIDKIEKQVEESQTIRRNETIFNLREIAFDESNSNTDRLKAIDLLNKMGGFYSDNINIQGSQTLELVIE